MDRVFVRYPEKGMRERLSFELPAKESTVAYTARTNSEISILDVSDEGRALLESEGAILYENVEFDKFPGDQGQGLDRLESLLAQWGDFPLEKCAKDVMEHINAPKAWKKSTGKGVTIAMVDSGVNGDQPEFVNRSTLDVPSAYQGDHWDDQVGHGTMCAAVACGSTKAGGKYDGVAPGATLLSARTTCRTDDIYDIFEQLIIWKTSGQIKGPLVVNNSYGVKLCVPPYKLPEDHPYLDIVKAAVSADIMVVFAAGNNHRDYCQHDPESHEPNSIWAANSADEVFCVGAVDWNERNTDAATPHSNSSRGPGQWSANRGKPDCVAPCYGEVLWKSSYLYLPWWGTSGAAPQVAGLAALVLSLNPTMKPHQVAELILNACKSLPGHEYCIGKGLIDCQQAVAAL